MITGAFNYLYLHFHHLYLNLYNITVIINITIILPAMFLFSRSWYNIHGMNIIVLIVFTEMQTYFPFFITAALPTYKAAFRLNN